MLVLTNGVEVSKKPIVFTHFTIICLSNHPKIKQSLKKNILKTCMVHRKAHEPAAYLSSPAQAGSDAVQHDGNLARSDSQARAICARPSKYWLAKMGAGKGGELTSLIKEQDLTMLGMSHD